MEEKQPLLEISDLSVSFRMYDGSLEQRQLQVISSLSLTVYPGEILAVAQSLFTPTPQTCHHCLNINRVAKNLLFCQAFLYSS